MCATRLEIVMNRARERIHHVARGTRTRMLKLTQTCAGCTAHVLFTFGISWSVCVFALSCGWESCHARRLACGTLIVGAHTEVSGWQ